MANNTLKKQIEEWKNRGPIRVWRKENKLSMRDAAGLLGVNLYTIQAWENGNSFPNAENVALLIEKTKDPDLVEKWKYWWKDGVEGNGSKRIAEKNGGVLY